MICAFLCRILKVFAKPATETLLKNFEFSNICFRHHPDFKVERWKQFYNGEGQSELLYQEKRTFKIFLEG